MPRGIPLSGKRRVKRRAVTQPLDKPYRLIPLTHRKIAVVDAEDFSRVSAFNWNARKHRYTWYAYRGQNVSMHATICGFKNVDHKDGDGLNNRRKNLRASSNSQNQFNKRIQSNSTSGFKGVCWHVYGWQARITIGNHKRMSLGHFETPEEAARAYNEAALKLYGEFARLNKLP